MLFEYNSQVYRRVSQGLTIVAIIGALRVGHGIIKKDNKTVKNLLPYTIAATALAYGSNKFYKKLEDKINQGDRK